MRELIDALQPAFEVLANRGTLTFAAAAAGKGAEHTKTIVNTKFGRSSYLSEAVLKNIPNPGAEVIARVFERIALL